MRHAAAIPLLLTALACNLGQGIGGNLEPTVLAAMVPTASPVVSGPPTPAYIPVECAGVPLATLAPERRPTPEPEVNPPLNLPAQLEVLRGLENAVRDLYLYPDFGGLDWPTAAAETRTRIEAGMDTQVFYEALGELVLRLGDEHSYFQTPAEIAAEQATIEGQFDFVGIGVLVQPRIGKGLGTILAVLPGSPAERSGLRPHDNILAIDGVQSAEGGIPQQQLLRGPACSQVVLTVRTPGGPERQVGLVRSAVSGALPINASLLPTADGSRIGYLFFPTFLDQSLPDRVEQALPDLGPLHGLILDDRVNGGGLGSVAEAMLGFFTSGMVGSFVDRSGQTPLTIVANPVHDSQSVPLVVLIGADTVSYGEIFAGVLQDMGRAQLVGQATLGNVERLSQVDLADGSRLWLAVERFQPLNSDADWEQQGILPDIAVPGDWEDFTPEDDPALAVALQLLGYP